MMFWIEPVKLPPTDKFIVVRYKDHTLELNQSPYTISYGQDTQKMIDENSVAYWCEINPPIPVKNVFTPQTLKSHWRDIGFKVENE